METIFRFIPESWIFALGWTVVHSLWQGALLALLLSAFRFGSRRLSPQIRYAAGWIALGGLFLSSVLTFSYQLETATVGAGIEVSFSGVVESTQSVSYLSTITGFLNQHLPLLVGAWFAGMLFFAIKTAGGYWYVNRLRNSGVALSEPDWQRRLDAIAAKMKIRRPVRLMESLQVSVPLVIGHIKPLVLLPVGLVNQLSPSEVEAIIGHELAHIRRHDFLLNLIQSILEILYYFNPAAWYISMTIRAERENCCDDWAVNLCGSSLTYVQALVQLEERRTVDGTPQFALSIAGEGKPLLQRVRRILNQPNHKKTVMERFTATLLLLAAVAVFSVSAGQPDEGLIIADEASPVQATLQQATDTIPPPVDQKMEKAKIIKQKGDQEMELTMENGTILEFKVDGEVIPPEEMDSYQEDIDAMRADMKLAAIPPPPPLPPTSGVDAPPPPPAPGVPGVEREIEVITETDQDGNVMIWVEDESEPIEVIVKKKDVRISGDPEKEEVIIIKEGEGPVILKGKKLHFMGEDEQIIWSLEEEEQEFKEQERITREHPVHKEHERARREYDRALQEELRAIEEAKRELREHQREIEKGAQREIEIEIQRHKEKMKDKQNHFFEFDTEIAPNVPDVEPFIWRGEIAPFMGERSLKSAIERELKRDGYIRANGTYDFKLSGKKLVINGKRESDVIFRKYKKIYEKQTGLNLSKDTRIEIEE